MPHPAQPSPAHQLTPPLPSAPPLPIFRSEGRAVPDGRVAYAGRDPSASTATGFGEVHKREQAELIAEALDLTGAAA